MNRAMKTLLILFMVLGCVREAVTAPIKIPFSQTEEGHIIITAKVNGVKGKFIFDTGAGVNLLTKDFADKITDLKDTHHFYTGHRATGERLQLDLWKSRLLEVDNFKTSNETFTVFDIDFPLAGLISLTPFKNQPITIDFENQLLTLETDESLKKIVEEKDYVMPLQITNDRDIVISMSTTILLENELTLNVRLDSGAGFDVYRFNSQYMDELGIDKAKIKSKYKPSSFKPEEGNRYYYVNMSKMVGVNSNKAITDFKATFIDGLIYEGIMGINWIGKKITIDIANKKLIVRKE